MKVFSPGKIILSGEHSAVYGAPALAMAVNRYAEVTVLRTAKHTISFHLANFKEVSHFDLSSLMALKERIKKSYQQFLKGEIHIRDVLQKPMELAQMAVSLCLDRAVLKEGLQFKLNSTIPVGCGMGSSAATILSMMQAVYQYAGLNLSKESIFKAALEVENLQHGRSSGLDLQVSLHGGCCFLNDDKIVSRPPPARPLFLVNTGTPLSSTGECVTQAASYFQSPELRKSFAEITIAIDTAVQHNHDFSEFIRENHRLLTHIGVVPEKVQRFIFEVEQMGGAAKISGAGAVAGDNAGLLVVILQEEELKKLSERFGFSILAIQGESRGTYVDI